MLRSLYTTGTRSFFLCLVVSACAALPAAAQDPDPYASAPAHVAFVDGVVMLERDGRIENEPGNMPLLAGDRLRTRGGRVEVLFADGSTLHLDHHSAVDFQSDELIRLVEGRIRLTIPGPAREVAYRIDGPQGWAQIREPGEYRVALLNAPAGQELELAVIRGFAELANNDGQTPLRAGERAFARLGAAPSYAYVANSAAVDAFDRWSEMRRDERLSANAEYLPDEVRPYAASLEAHGYWREEATYGRVWYPRVGRDWRPYYRGRWVNLRPYGWTWVAYDPWGWPTHHYGRWGLSPAGAWFWIPGRTWGAAWVSWAHAPGYVSWCPLGWNNRPIFQINITVGRHYDPWRAWTVIPRRHFGYGYVHRNVVRPNLIDVRVRGAFTHAERAPEIRGYAVPRSGAPIRVAGTGARPRLHEGSGGQARSGSPLYTNLPEDRGRLSTDGARITVPGGVTPRGARPSAEPRERATPTRPAVRVDRSTDAQVEQRGDRQAQPRAVEPGRPIDRSRGSADPGRGRDTDTRRAIPRATPPPRSGEPPRAIDGPRRSATPSGSPGRIERAPAPAPPPIERAVPRPGGSGAPGPGAVRRMETPRPDAQRPGGVRRVEPPRSDARRPDSAPAPRAGGAVRRTEPSRPPQAVVPQGGRSEARPPSGGATRPPAVSNPGARPAPAGARPSSPSSQGPSKAVPRPRGGGGGEVR